MIPSQSKLVGRFNDFLIGVSDDLDEIEVVDEETGLDILLDLDADAAEAAEFGLPDQPRDEDGQWTAGDGGRPKVEAASKNSGVGLKSSGKNVERLQAVIDALPADHVASLAGVNIVSVGALHGLGRGAAGLYSPEDRTIRVAERAIFSDGARNIADQEGVLTHEIGHALDDARGLSRGLSTVMQADAAKLNNSEKYVAKYWLESESEWFAELYKVGHSPSKSGGFGMKQKTAERKFAGALAEMRAMLDKGR